MAAEPQPLLIRRIQASDGSNLRELRLRSIDDAPDSFGQTLEEARARPEAEWHRNARQSSRGDSRTWFFALRGDELAGLVQGRRRRPTTLLLFSMWVDPSVRRRGVGRELIEALEVWASQWTAQETILWVYRGNSHAQSFYQDLGFEVLEEGEDVELGAQFGALAMQRHIKAAAERA